jgi:RNA polymerase sigma-70 factor (ECF subfamily)
MAEAIDPEALQALVRSHDRFLKFLQSRVESREAAEDVLQAAFVRGIERGEQIREGENAVAWFYRVLRNAVVDHHRRRQVEARALRRASREPDETDSEDPELERAVCQCLKELLPTLKGEYAEALRKVDLEGRAIGDVAREANVTPGNLMVRLHRARKALHGRLVQACGACTEHECLDCHCKG